MSASIDDMAKRIREIMESQEMSQQDFAAKLNIPAASLSNILNGRTRPTNNHTVAIHNAYPELSTNWLLFGEGEMYQSENTKTTLPKSEEIGRISSPDLFDNIETTPRNNIPPSTNTPTLQYPSVHIQSMHYEKNAMLNNYDNKKRQIKEIRVFYDDGTYESFSPQKS